jgi:hypothetical protein
MISSNAIPIFGLLLLLLAGTPGDSAKELITIKVHSAESVQDQFGETLALVGDLNKDGFPDFAVGASGQGSAGAPMSGAVHLYSGLTGRKIGAVRGEQAFSRFGRSIASGDLNRDGHIELLLGAPYHGGLANRSCGRVSLYSFQKSRFILHIDGKNPSDRFGWSLGCMDVDGDDYEDILVGAPGFAGHAGPGSGAVFIYSGKDGKPIRTLEGESAGDGFGFGLACFDADMDGFADVLAHAPGHDDDMGQDRGCLHAYSGQTGHLLYQVLPDATLRCFGTRISLLQDLNLDGIQDFAIPALGNETDNLRVFDGALGAPLFDLSIEDGNLGLNRPVISIGDLDGDGIPDLGLGSESEGQCYFDILSGRDRTLLERWTVTDAASAAGYNQCDPLGSDPTGFPRIVLASNPFLNRGDEKPGRVGMYHMAPPGVLFRLRGSSDGERYGSIVKIIADLSGDGRPDLLVGCPAMSGRKGEHIGRIYIYSSTGGKPIKVLRGETGGSRFGQSLALIGDVDGDGLQDFLASAPGYAETDKEDMGRVYVYSSKTRSLLPEPLTGRMTSDMMGKALLAVGDANGNKVPDYLVSMPGDAKARAPGMVLLVEGKNGRAVQNFRGLRGDYSLGSALGRVADLDGDGADEFLCSCLHVAKSGTFPIQRVHMYSIRMKKPIFTFEAPEASLTFGTSLAGIHDTNGDGKPDFMIADPGYSEEEARGKGRIYIYSGKKGDLLGHITGAEAGDGFGRRIARIRDLDQDGVPDLAVTATVSGRGVIYLFGSRSFQLLGRIDGREGWDGFACSISGDPSGDPELGILLFVGANRYGRDGFEEGGAAFALDLDLASYLAEPGYPLPELFLVPPPEPPPSEEASTTEASPGQASTESSRMPLADQARHFYLIRSGMIGTNRSLPLRKPTWLEEVMEAGFIHPAFTQDPEGVSRWTRSYWFRSKRHFAPALGFRFKLIYMAGGGPQQKILEVLP